MNEACDDATSSADLACITKSTGSRAALSASSVSGTLVAQSPQTCTQMEAFALFVRLPVTRSPSTLSISKSVMVRRGSGSVDMMSGTSLASSAEFENPRCLMQGSFLRDLPAIQRRSASFAQMPTASGDAGVHMGSVLMESHLLTVIRLGRRSTDGSGMEDTRECASVISLTIDSAAAS